MGNAVLLMLPDEVLKALPHRQVVVVLRVPIVVEFITRKNADLTRSAFDDARVLDTIDRNTAGAGKVVSDTVIPLASPVLLEPGDGEPRVRVELTLDTAEVFVEFPIDELKRSLHAHRTVIGFQNGLVPREHAHAGADGRLRHIGWGDVGGLKLGDRRRKFAFQGANELSAGNALGRGLFLPANENDRIGESICPRSNHAVRHLGAQRPSPNDGIAGFDNRLQEGCPAG